MSADDLDLDCSAAATDVLNRARDEELLIASLESSLKVSQAVAAALTAMADERAGEPSRKARGIRLVHDDSDGEMMATDADDVEEPAPAAADVEQPVPATPAGLFSDVFGNPDAGWGCERWTTSTWTCWWRVSATSTPSIACRRPSRCGRPLGIGSAYPPKTSLPQSRNISATIGIYTTGEQYFGALQEAIRKRWRDKHPALDHEPVERSPRRRRNGTLRTIPRAMGIDAIDDRIGGDSIGEDEN